MRKKGGLRNLAITAIWFLIAVGVLLAVGQKLGVSSVESVISIAKEKAVYYSKCIPAGDCGLVAIIDDLDNSNPDLNISNPSGPDSSGNNGNATSNDNTTISKETKGYRGPIKGEPYVNEAGIVHKNEILLKLENVNIVEKAEDVEYSRAEWKHWSGTEGRSCWNTREEILHRDAKPGTIVYVDKQMNVTEDYNEACAIGRPVEIDGKLRVDTENSGEWIDPYSGRKITSSSDIDIDHIIPLSYAASHGGQKWDEDLKEQFANDPDNLLATSAKENRAKGDKGPSEYMPPYSAYHCQYAKSFTYVADKYDLSITKADYETLKKVLQSCQY